MSRRPPNKPSRRRSSTRARTRSCATDVGNGPVDTQHASISGLVQPVEIKEELELSFLDYSMSVIISRALPDARDGLKPVQRKILYAMNTPDLAARPDRVQIKCARVTGEVTGKYHPHSEEAVYDAMVRMGQDHSVRYPLIDGHGNFGSPDDEAAARRYTEARLSPLAMEMLAGIEENTVDFIPNYTNEFSEPTVL